MSRLGRSVVVFLPLLVAWASPPFQDGQGKTAPFPRAGAYAGEAVCKDCHEDQWEAIHGGVHRAVVEAKELKACETCHGPGKAHADADDNDAELITHPPDLGRGVVAFCGRCHAEAARAHGGDVQGFLAAGKTCTSCHEVHRKTPTSPPHAEVAFFRRIDQAAHPGIDAVGAPKCVECHPLRDQALAAGAHAHLTAATRQDGCETCHGPGSLHVETKGLARLITRPDRAGDGAATCRSCHAEIDPIDFHWKDRKKPLLSASVTCTTCHSIHGRIEAADATPATPATNDVCRRCHEPAFDLIEGSIHATVGNPSRPLADGCGACHPGALAHAESGGKPQLIESLHTADVRTQRQVCLRCHEHEGALTHFEVGSHARHEVGCVTCHSWAAPRGQVRRDAEGKCATCHQAVAAEFAQPNHHPVPEHAMGCSDCHDPHGARPKLRDLELRQDRCVRCHTQYRGPFVFAHQASRSDGCVVCHQPHGASNKRLLRQHTPQQNCLQCHADFPIFHDQTTGAVFTNCLNCHTEVHGSNHARFLFR